MADATYSATARAASGGGTLDYLKYNNAGYPYKDITSKQAGTIYRALKNDNVKLSKTDVSIMYDIYTSPVSGYRQVTTDASFQGVASALDGAVSAIHASDYKAAQQLLDEAFDEHYRVTGGKRK